MDWSFEAGLLDVWDELYYKALKDTEDILPLNSRLPKENHYLNFALIAPFLLILVFGFASATFVLFLEIFHHDFFKNLSKEYFRRKFKINQPRRSTKML